MPALTLSTIRKPYAYRGYLTVVPEVVVLQGTLTGTPSYPALTLAYTLTAGDEGDVLPDMEVELYSSANVFKGRLRVALGGTISSTSLPVNEFSRGRLDIVSGDKFKVLRSWRIRDRLVAANATFDKDSRIAYTTQNEDIAPLACAGGPWAGFHDVGQSYATLELSAAESRALAVDSGGDLNYLWDVQDGTITVGTDTDETITVRFPVGSRWVHLQVEDDDNGATSDYYFPVVVHNRTNARPHEVIVNTLDGERLTGWRFNFQLPAGADTTALPDGALIIYHEDEFYGGVSGSYGHPVSNRSRIKFVGYVTADSITVDAFTNEVSFDAVGPLGILENLPGFSQILTDVADPANWQEYKDLTLFQAIVYLIRNGTTLPNVCDIVFYSDDASYPELFIQKAVPSQQVRELSDGMSWEWLCDRTGRMMFARKLTRSDSTDRNAATSMATLTSDDRIRITARREHRSSLNTLIARGFSAGSGPVPMISKAPGAAPDEGAGETIIERLIESNQDALNDLSGWAYAEQTKRFNGIPAPSVDSELPGNYDCLDFYPEWLAMTLVSSANKRGLGLTAARGLLDRISVSRDTARRSKQLSISWQHETDGAPGVAQPVSQGDTTPSDDYPAIDYFPPGTIDNVLLYSGTRRIAVFGANGIAKTANFGSGNATVWGYTTYASLSIAGTPLLWVPHGSDPGKGWLITSSKIYYLDLVSLAAPTDKYSFAVANDAHKADASIGVANHLVVSTYDNTNGGRLVYTTDNSSFNVTSIAAGKNSNPTIPWASDVFVSTQTPGKVYVCGYPSNGDRPPSAGYQSLSYGASPASMSSPDISTTRILPPALHVPYHNNPGEKKAIMANEINTAGATRLYRVDDAARTDITYLEGGTYYAPEASRGQIATPFQNRNTLLVAAQEQPATAFLKTIISHDAWATTPTWELLIDNSPYSRNFFAGDDERTIYLIGSDVALTTDQGLNIASQFGNLGDFSFSGIFAIAGY